MSFSRVSSGEENPQTPPPHSFPPVLDVADLAVLMRQAVPTILSNRTRAPERVPPSCQPPGARQPLWLLEDVLAWLRQHQHQRPVSAKAKVGAKVGRPTKADQIARRKAQAEKNGGQQ